MFRFLCAALLFLFATVATRAQGVSAFQVVDESGQPLGGVTVSLLRSDSSLAKLTVTGKDGFFDFPEARADNILKFSMVGYSTTYLELSQIAELHTIVLKGDVKTLNFVTVQAKKPLYQYLPDRTILNIDAAPSNAGNTLLELLQKIPDLSVGSDGSITLNGKPGVLVQIDGRETYLSGADLLNLLRSMPASGSDQIEIISNPSSKYEASATGGIINIRTKRHLYDGLNGNISTSTGAAVYNDVDGSNRLAPVHNTSVNWNYRKRKFNVYGNVDYERGIYFENFKTWRHFFDPGTKLPQGSYFSWSHIRTPDNFYQLRVAADLTLNSRHLFGFIVSGSYRSSNSKGGTNSYVMDNDERVVYRMRSTIESPEANNFNGNYNLNHKYSSKNKKFEWFSDASYLTYNSISHTENQTDFLDSFSQPFQPSLLRRQTAENKFKGAVFKTDMTIAGWLDWKWEGGYKYSFIETVSDPRFLRKVNGDFVVDGGRTNHFVYSDRIHALYLMGTRSFAKTAVQAGLRMEAARGKGYERITDSSFSRKWLNIFPSVFLKREVSKGYQFIVNYTRKIRRPTAGQLNPFTYFTDSLYANSGNPFLQPHFFHNIELKNIIRNKYAVVLSYIRVKDFMTMVVQQNPVNKTTQVTQQNFGTYQLLSLSASAPVTFRRWWQSNLSSTVGHITARGEAFQFAVREWSTYWSLTMSHQFIFSKSWFADFNLSYNTTQLSGLLVLSRPLSYSLGVRKNFDKNKGSISFSSTSPFFIPRYGFDADYGNTVYESRFTNMNQNYKVTVSLKFGKETVKRQRDKKNATDEEQSRM